MPIARGAAELRADDGITQGMAPDGRGNPAQGSGGGTPDAHDLLTGSRRDGTACPPAPTLTRSHWPRSGDGQATSGHGDRQGLVTGLWTPG